MEQTNYYSDEAEKSAIAGVLIDMSKIPELIDIPESHFYLSETRLAFRGICEMYQNALDADLFTLSDYLERQQLLPGTDWLGVLNDWTENTVTSTQFSGYITALGDYAQLREIQKLTVDLQAQLKTNTAQEIIEALQDRVVDMSSKQQTSGFQGFKSVLSDGLDEIERRQDMDGRPSGQTTQYELLDNTLDGFEDGKIYVIAGRTGMGKSALALQLLYRLAHENSRPWFKFSLEMTSKSIGMRAISNASNIFGNKLKGRPKLEDSDNNQMGAAVSAWMSKPIYVDQSPSLSVAQMRARLKVQAVRHGSIGGIVVDHIGLVKAPKDARGATEAMASISHALQSMAKEFNCPLIELVQINRSTEGTKDNRPALHQLKQSGAIEEDADVVMLLYRDEYYNKESNDIGMTEVNIAKNRDGECKTIAFSHVLATGRYEEIGERAPPDDNKIGRSKLEGLT